MRLILFNITISTEVDMYGVALSKWEKNYGGIGRQHPAQGDTGVLGGAIAELD
jgi:hypothetical protein